MSNNVGKPKYKHDCERCVWLGTITYPAPLSNETTRMTNADLYCCKESIGGPSIIARFSSDGAAYASLAASIIEQYYMPKLGNNTMGQMSTCGPALISAYVYAKAKGLV